MRQETNLTDERRAQRIRRLLYQSWYRGCKETDRILGWFVKTHIHAFSDSEIDATERIMLENDADIFRWISKQQELPSQYNGDPVMKLLLAFDVAAACKGEPEERDGKAAGPC